MKHIKHYEKSKNYNKIGFILQNTKKYIIVEENNKNIYLDEIIKIGISRVFIKDILYYNHQENKIKEQNSHTEATLNYLDDIIFTSDNYDETKDHFILLIESNKYNL